MEKDMLFGIVVAVAGVLCMIKTMLDRKGERLQGVISDFVMRNGYPFPVVKFTYQGSEKEMRAANADSKKKRSVGDRVDIVYKPSNSEYVNILGDNLDIAISVGLIVAGIALIILQFFR